MTTHDVRVPEGLRHAKRVALAAGWELSMQGNGKVRWTAPNGKWAVTSSGGGGSARATANGLASLRRIGLRA